MIDESEIVALAEKSAPERCYVSVYLNRDDRAWLEGALIPDDVLAEPSGFEAENLEPTMQMLRDELEGRDFESVAVGVFACWADDFLEVVELDVPVERRVVAGPSPFVLPLAEIADEFESWCVVLADHSAARLFQVTGLDIEETDRVAGDIKNSVKVGGWSQQRYERRREKEISEYCDEIADRLDELADTGACDRIVLAGNEKLVAELERELPSRLRDRVVGARRLRTELAEAEVFEALEPVYESAERCDERGLLETIQTRRFRDGRAAIGPEATLEALREGRVQILVVDRESELRGARCRDCERVDASLVSECPVCGGEVFEVDLDNELVEFAERTGAEVETADPTEQLRAWGGVAALLRY